MWQEQPNLFALSSIHCRSLIPSSVSSAATPWPQFYTNRFINSSNFWFVQNAGARTNLESHGVAAELTDEGMVMGDDTASTNRATHRFVVLPLPFITSLFLRAFVRFVEFDCCSVFFVPLTLHGKRHRTFAYSLAVQNGRLGNYRRPNALLIIKAPDERIASPK